MKVHTRPIPTGGALFLDRDGVLNRLIEGDYVRTPDQLEILPRVPEAIALLNRHFSHTIIVTNQQCIAKGLVTTAQLEAIHHKLLSAVEAAGGRIDHIYYCPDLHGTHSPNRKPNTGMALQARRDYADIRLDRSVMVGDSMTDMLFGHRCGMVTVLLGHPRSAVCGDPRIVNHNYPTLWDFAQTLDQ